MIIQLFRFAAAALLGLSFWSGSATAKTVINAMEEAGAFAMFLNAVETANLQDLLMQQGPYTVFAPTDDTFTKLPGGYFDSLLHAETVEGQGNLKKLLRNHILAGLVASKDFIDRRREAITIDNGVLLVDATRAFIVENARISPPDIFADNGIVHVIDTVLIPRQAHEFFKWT